MLPSPAANKPGLQGTQAVEEAAPGAAEALPRSHLVHTAEAAPAQLPAEQARQSLGSAEPGEGENLPAGQGIPALMFEKGQ